MLTDFQKTHAARAILLRPNSNLQKVDRDSRCHYLAREFMYLPRGASGIRVATERLLLRIPSILELEEFKLWSVVKQNPLPKKIFQFLVGQFFVLITNDKDKSLVFKKLGNLRSALYFSKVANSQLVLYRKVVNAETQTRVNDRTINNIESQLLKQKTKISQQHSRILFL